MLSNLPTQRAGHRPRAAWVGATVLSLGFLFGSSAAFAVAPPANTVIGNQASASYADSTGTTQIATSNLVQTTVQQVGSFTLDSVNQPTTTVVNTKTGAAATVVYAPHILTNTGNGSDTFTISVTDDNNRFAKIEVYADANGDGVPDSTTPLCSAVPAAVCNVPAQTVAGSNGTFPFVVAYTIPSTATGTTPPFDTATILATPGTPALYTAPNTSASDKDQVNLTTVAAFNVTKTIGAPAVAAPGGGAWPTASTGGPRSATGVTCATTWVPGLASTANCYYTVYTLTFNNTGAQAGTFALSDTLPSGFTYLPGSAVWSNAPGLALGDGAGGDQPGIDFAVSGQTLNAVVASLAPNSTQTLSFVVTVNSSAAIGTSTTTNVAQYNPTDAGNVTSTAIGTVGSTTNPASYTVTATYSIAVGANGSTAVSAKDGTPGTPNSTPADLTTQPSVVPGGGVKFPQTVFNAGSGTDTVNLTTGSSTFPAGTTFQLFAADGVTPLLDTNGDGVPDTGPIAAGGSVNIVVQAIVPASTVVGSGPFSVTVTGKSGGDATKIDATLDTVTTVIGALVDLTNTAAGTGSGSVAGGDLGPGPSPLPTTTNTTPAGTGTVFTLFIKNNDSADNNYNLSASQTSSFPGSLPTGWTVKYVAAGGNCASAAAAMPVFVAKGKQVEVDACVTPPATQTAVTAQKIYFQVLSTGVGSTGVLVSDAKTDAVTVTVASTLSATLTPNNSGQVAPGGTVVYAHTLTNTGNQSCGAYTLTATLPAADVTAGWTTAIYLDVNGDGQIDQGDTLVTGSTPGPLPVGGTQKILVKVFAPGGASAGATDLATVTATFAAGAGNCGTPSATDLSTVVTGQIRVVKTQGPDTNCDGNVDPPASLSAAPLSLKPGQCIVYQVVATNQGTAPVSNLSINDALPAYTSLTGATQPAVQCSSLGMTGTAVAYTPTATTVKGVALDHFESCTFDGDGDVHIAGAAGGGLPDQCGCPPALGKRFGAIDPFRMAPGGFTAVQ
ncbi:beta strand repeat-containing protein [Xenophilus aerolatus]|nr:hypothetical protein [Xenophilus aerolatus]